MSVKIDRERCTNCNICVDRCVMDVLVAGDQVPDVARPNECWGCGACMMDCLSDAISFALPVWMKPVFVRVKQATPKAEV